jgi:AraC-like DNA-binding protein
VFWRDDRLPFIEARHVNDGRAVCYDKHTHETLSIGAITGGRSIYVNQRTREAVGGGAVVVINPGDVHACAAVEDRPWAYRMLYIDAPWIAGLEGDGRGVTPFATKLTTDPDLYHGLVRLHERLVDSEIDLLTKQGETIAFLSALQDKLVKAKSAPPQNDRLDRAAAFIDANCTRNIRLEDICAASGLSPAYLVRGFKRRFGLTPHARLMDRRVRYAKWQLKRGRPLVEVALDAGFADQPHFQRVFKRLVAATPRQYADA